MKIRTKLLLGIGSLFVALCATATLSVYFTDRLGSEAIKMYDGPTMSATFSQSAYTNFLRAQLFANEGDLEEVEYAIDDVLGDLEIVIERSAFSQTVEGANDLLPNVETWYDEISIALSEDKYKAEQFDDLTVEIETALDALVESVAEEGYWAREVAAKVQDTSSLVAVAVATIGGMIGLGAALFVGTNVSKSINTLKTAMDAVAQGDLSYPITTQLNRDETGAMARSLDGFRCAAATQLAVSAALESNDVPALVTDSHGSTIFSNTAFKSLMESREAGLILESLSDKDEENQNSKIWIDLLTYVPTEGETMKKSGDHIDVKPEKTNSTIITEDENNLIVQYLMDGSIEFRGHGAILACAVSKFGEAGSTTEGYAFEIRNVTAERTLLDAISEVTKQADLGCFDARIDVEGQVSDVAGFAAGLNSFLDVISSFTEEIDEVTLALANKNLSSRVDGAFNGAFAATQSQFNSGVESLASTISNVINTMSSVHQMIASIEQSSEQLNGQANRQSLELTKSAKSVRELAERFKEMSDETASLAVASKSMSVDVEKSADTIADAESAMVDIEAASAQVTDIIEVIDAIAFQTNLLALNAAVEAARAGEAGKGFEVVASEVRTLAQRSSDSAESVRSIIGQITGKIRDGGDTVKTAKSVMTRVSENAQVLAQSLQINSANQTELSADAGVRSDEIDTVKEDTFRTLTLTEKNQGDQKKVA